MQQQDGLLCGTTPHLTSFAVLLSGGGNNGQFTDQCTRSYVTGSSDGDIALAASVGGSIALVMLVVAALLSVTPAGRKLLYGAEGTRVRRARNASMNCRDDDNPEEQGELA
jgi:hypothetical protein